MSRKLTTKEFIEKAKKLHGNKYIYTNVNYINSKTKIKIICPKHGEFKQTPNNHLNGKNCVNCSGLKKLTLTEIINRCNKKFNNKYDYSLIKNFNTRKTKINIICPKHGIFIKTIINHLQGQGCTKCVKKYKPSTNEFVEKVKKIHGNKYIYTNVDYINNKIKIKIICPKHGEFYQIPHNHLRGKGCGKCGGNNKLTTKEFIKKSNIKHKGFFNYSKTVYNLTHEKVIIICPKHGEFKQAPSSHLSGKRCPKCRESIGESNIRFFLEKNDINFTPQKRFKDCRNIKPLPFDFYLPRFNTCIEFDGHQHHKPVKYWGGNKGYLLQIKKDKIKNIYCKKNNIELFRITKKDDYKKIINNIIKVV